MNSSPFISTGIVIALLAAIALLLRRFRLRLEGAASREPIPETSIPPSAYALAVAVTAMAVCLRWLMDPWLREALPFVTLFGAVAAGVWIGGYRPALVATGLGYLACAYLFIEPRNSLAIVELRDCIGLVLYLFTCSIIIALGEGMLVAQRVARVREQELRESAEALKEADRRKTEFLAMLAHELRNPLAPISNALQLIRRTGAEGKTVEVVAEMMERQVNQIVRLVDDLLEVNRISRGKVELRRERVDLTSILYHAVDLARPVCDKAELVLSVQMPTTRFYLDADAVRLSQVLGNLLSNACKFTDRGGRVQLGVESDVDHVVIRVRDTGVGIAAEQLSDIFDMFAQVDSSRQRSQGGLGIGLTLAKILVEMHGGTIAAHSAGLGQGSEFTVRLPILQDAPASPPIALGADAPAMSPRRILVVDDNVDAVESLAMLLRSEGHDVHIAYDGLEAVAAAAALQPDVILLDIGLPGIDGYEAARRIRQLQNGKRIMLVALTGWGQDEDRRRSADAGFDAHLVKPVECDALAALLVSLASEGGRTAN